MIKREYRYELIETDKKGNIIRREQVPDQTSLDCVYWVDGCFDKYKPAANGYALSLFRVYRDKKALIECRYR